MNNGPDVCDVQSAFLEYHIGPLHSLCRSPMAGYSVPLEFESIYVVSVTKKVYA